MTQNFNFEFLHWVVDNHIPKVAAKSNQHYNRWIVVQNGIHPNYFTDQELYEYWANNIAKSTLGDLGQLAIDTHRINSHLENVPMAGMGATMPAGSDSYPYTIHRVSADRKHIWASADCYSAIPRADGRERKIGESIEYTYSNFNANKPEMWTEFVLRKNGKYVQKGLGLKNRGLIIGYRDYYQDPSF